MRSMNSFTSGLIMFIVGLITSHQILYAGLCINLIEFGMFGPNVNLGTCDPLITGIILFVFSGLALFGILLMIFGEFWKPKRIDKNE